MITFTYYWINRFKNRHINILTNGDKGLEILYQNLEILYQIEKYLWPSLFFNLGSSLSFFPFLYFPADITLSGHVWGPVGRPVEKAMAPHSSTLAWKIPWTEEPGRLQSMGSLRVGHDWATSLWLFTFMYWRRKWQPTPVFLPGEFQRRGSLVGCLLWGHTESDTTEVT